MNIDIDNVVLKALAVIGLGILVVLLGTLFSLLFRGIDRRLSARMQGRYGPPVVQPFRDVRKLLMKESIVPGGAIGWLFNAAPLLAAAASVVLLVYIPLFGQPPLLSMYGDIILVLYLLIVPSLALVAGGFASGSPYATVGSQREMVIMMSYELPLAVVIIAIVWMVNSAGVADPFLLGTITANPFWGMVGPLGIIGGIVMLLVLAVVSLGESAKVPFDIAEAETEIAGGMLVEYSGRNLLLFYLADVVKTFVMASLVVALFIPYTLSPLVGVSATVPAGIIDGVFFLVKVFVVMFLGTTVIRTAMARFTISRASSIYVIAMAGFALLGMLLLWIDTLL